MLLLTTILSLYCMYSIIVINTKYSFLGVHDFYVNILLIKTMWQNMESIFWTCSNESISGRIVVHVCTSALRSATRNKRDAPLSHFRTLREDLLRLGRDVHRVRRQGSVPMSCGLSHDFWSRLRLGRRDLHELLSPAAGQLSEEEKHQGEASGRVRWVLSLSIRNTGRFLGSVLAQERRWDRTICRAQDPPSVYSLDTEREKVFFLGFFSELSRFFLPTRSFFPLIQFWLDSIESTWHRSSFSFDSGIYSNGSRESCGWFVDFSEYGLSVSPSLSLIVVEI